MITRVAIADFLSHRDTTLEFGAGVNVITGPNGAGKSSVVDAITFALFGKHTRPKNKSLVRHGASSCMTQVEFASGRRTFEVTRKVLGAGSEALLREKKDGEWLDLAAGERRKMDESTANEVAKILGMDFDKLQIASIVRQGELAAIVHDKPKDFKMRINDIIGMDKLDEASGRMGELLAGFRAHVREKLGYDDTHLPTLRSELEGDSERLARAKEAASGLAAQRDDLVRAIGELDAQIERMREGAQAREQWDKRLAELSQYAGERRRAVHAEYLALSESIPRCRSALGHREKGRAAAGELERERAAREKAVSAEQAQRVRLAEIRERIKISGRLELRDGRCPICDSRVESLSPMFARDHLAADKSRAEAEIAGHKKAADGAAARITQLERLERLVAESDATLRAHSVSSASDIEAMEARAGDLGAARDLADACIAGDWRQAAKMDDQGRAHCTALSRLEPLLPGDGDPGIEEIRVEHDNAVRRLDDATSEHGAAKSRAEDLESRIDGGKKLLAGLEKARAYVARIEAMRQVFSRDGAVSASMRSWALTTISEACTRYLEVLDTRIRRVTLAEKSDKLRSVVLTCHAGGETFEIDSLSGGEQVCVALALRLGMAGLLGSRGPSFVILDEPTAHLDAERRKSLAHMLAGLTGSSGSPAQLIIITHDMEIFDEAPVERRYEFEPGPGGTEYSLR